MIPIKRRLYRERRRFIVIAITSFIAGLAAGLNDDRIVFGIPFQLAYGVAFALILTPVLMAFALLFPKIRNVTESVAFSLPFICWMNTYGGNPESSFLQSSSMILGLVFTYLVFAVYGGGWLDRYLPAKKQVFHSKSKTQLSPEELWPFLFVTPDNVETYGGEKTVSMRWVEPGVSYVATEQVDDFTRIEELQTIENLEPDAQIRVRFEILSAANDTGAISGWAERKFNRAAKGTYLFSTRCFDRMSPTANLRLWLDDDLGRGDDENVSRAEQMSRL